MPAVVNLSLGSDFGAHDGSSGLEQGLGAMVGPAVPGRAIVVAAGNSAGLTDGSALQSKYSGPFGIHSEVHVPRYVGTRVPLLTPPRKGEALNATVYVWIGFRNGDEVSVGVDDQSGTVVPLVAAGNGDKFEDDQLAVAVLNGSAPGAATDSIDPGRNGAIVSISGTWAADRDFSIRLAGHGTAELWAQGQGDLNPEIGYGALFPRATKEGTINVPASASALIAVGATLNRNAWLDVNGDAIDMPDLGALTNAPLDSIAYFSSAGPNALGALKPDLVAPGVFVAGAMARSADPRRSSNELFASLGRCPTQDECFVVDETHAITSGTSMSSPIVAGAIALLFQRDPTLTQDGVRAILQAGARPLEGTIIDPRQIGPGALDLEGALAVASAGESPALRVPTARSWLTLTASSAHPDPTWPVSGYLDLRDDAGNLADGFDPTRLQLTARPATVREPLTRVAPGFFRFAVTAPSDTGGQTMQLAVRFDDQLIASAVLPIVRLPDEAASPSGGCGVGGTSTNSGAALAAGALLAFASLRRRRHMRAK
jgi:MYXO-CTERM domain-containing protein